MKPNQNSRSKTQRSIPLLNGKKKILVVEDDEDFRDAICSVLQSEAYQIRSAENGLVAKTILISNQNYFDLVISDIEMPEIDGIALLKFTKATFPKTKFIIITGYSEKQNSKNTNSLNADGFLAKPFGVGDLVAMIEKVLLCT